MRTFFIIGAQRSGTTSLAQVLGRQALVSIIGAQPPEPRLFLKYDDPSMALSTLLDRAEPDTQWMGCKSTTYLERPEAAQRIQRVAPQSAIIVLLRDPVARAISNYHFTACHGLESLPIDEALRPEAQARPWDATAISTNPFAYLQRSRYAELLEPWLACFPDTSIFILEELVSGTDSLERLQEVMGIEVEDFTLEWTHENQGEAMSDPPSQATIHRLREYFTEPHERLEELLGRSIEAWPQPSWT